MSKRRISILALACHLLLVPGNAQAQADEKTLFFISNSHLDTQWNWDVKTTIEEYIPNTLNQNMALMDKYPHFMLNFEGAIKYMWMKEYYPTQYEAMKKYIQAGRWHVSGMSVDATDVMISSAESILHSMLYANKFYQKEFGVRGGYDIMLPDCFGFSYALPSLARHAGIRGFHSAKLAWGSEAYNSLPPFGIWQGVDGSQIYALYKPGAYDNHEDFNKDMTMDADMLSTINTNKEKYGVPAMFRYVGPRSDHGGGLKDDASSDTENTPYWLNLMAGKKDGNIQVKLVTPDECFDYLDKHKNEKYHVWNNELPMKSHGVGAYTSWGILKRWNRKNELTADAAEKASSLSYWLGVRNYPSEQIKDAWIRTIWQQHHDGLPGTSILKANDYSYNEYYTANKIFSRELKTSVGATTQYMDTQVEGTPIVVYNPLSHDRKDVVEGTMPCATKPLGIRVYGPDGTEVLSQITGYDEKTGQLRFIFAASVPSLGYAVYDVRVGEASSLTSTLAADPTAMQINNGHYQVDLTSSGNIAKVSDLEKSNTLLREVKLQMIYDHQDVWPAWEVSYTDVCRNPSDIVGGDAEITLVEDGALRKSFRIKRQTAGSTFIQYVRMSALSDRIDCVNEVDWQTPKRMLKVLFPFTFSNPNTTYDISLGTIQRSIRTSEHYEMQGHQWADHSSRSKQFGVSILNDCKYGWDKPANNSLRLTLLHTPSCGGYRHQANMDLGPNHFTYSIFPHDGDWTQQTQVEAARLNQPLLGFVADKHEGQLGRIVKFASLNTEKVSVKALKKAEDTDELIVRIYEWAGEDQTGVQMSFPVDILSAREVNALEEEVGSVAFEGKQMTFDIGHYQPKTFAIRLKTPEAVTQNIHEGTSVPITYNTDLMSYDKARGNANRIYTTHAYPADLIADELHVDGIRFAMGERTDGKYNALRISGQTLQLNRTNGENKLYLLMASTTEQGSVAKVTINGTEQSIQVPYFSGSMASPIAPTTFNASYRRDNVAFASSHAHNVEKKSNEIMKQMYIYKYCVELPEDATEVTISSSNRYLFLFSATIAANKTDDLQEFTSLLTEIDYVELSGENMSDNRLVPQTVTASHEIGSHESAKMANDQNTSTKWCVTGAQSETPYLEYTFKEPVVIQKWMVLCAAEESGDYVASDFKLQYQNESGAWVDADTVEKNQVNKITRYLTEITTSRVRLQMQKGEQDGYTTRIYEFAVYGHKESETGIYSMKDGKDIESDAVYNLAGQQVSSSYKGVTLKNGKKILVK